MSVTTHRAGRNAAQRRIWCGSSPPSRQPAGDVHLAHRDVEARALRDAGLDPLGVRAHEERARRWRRWAGRAGARGGW